MPKTFVDIVLYSSQDAMKTNKLPIKC